MNWRGVPSDRGTPYPTMETSFTLAPGWLGEAQIADFVAPLAAVGLDSLEIILHPGEEDWTVVQRLAENCAELGWRCHFHLPYRKPANLQGFSSERRMLVESMFLPAIEFAERVAAKYSFHPAIVIHGAWGERTLDELIRDTKQFLIWTLTQVRYAQPVLELLPHKTATRAGESREEVLAIVKGIGDERLGLCWDLGHDMLLGYRDLPSEEFLRTVKHVHLHDVNPAQQDHYPVIYGNVPWESDLRALMEVGYTGAVTLELNRERTQQIDRWDERIRESLRSIVNVIKAPAPAAKKKE